MIKQQREMQPCLGLRQLRMNNRGQALIQAMMVLGLMGIMGYSALQINSSIRDVDIRLSVSRDLDSTNSMIKSALNTEQLCNQYVRVRGRAGLDPGWRRAGAGGPKHVYNGPPPGLVANGTKTAMEVVIPFYPGLGDAGWFPHPSNESQNLLPDLRVRMIGFTYEQIDRTDNFPDATKETYRGLLSFVAESQTAGRKFVGRRDIGIFTLVVDKPSGGLIGCTAEGSMSDICTQVGGRWMPELTPQCQFGLVDTDCPDGEFIYRLNPDGTSECRSAEFSCEPQYGQLYTLVGIKDEGGIPVADCRPYYADSTTSPPPPDLLWRQLPWSACTVNCGGGTQTASHECFNNDTGMVVPDGFCTTAGLAKPADVSQACNTQTCNCINVSPTWTAGANSCTAGTPQTIANGGSAAFSDTNFSVGQESVGNANFGCTDGYLVPPSGGTPVGSTCGDPAPCTVVLAHTNWGGGTYGNVAGCTAPAAVGSVIAHTGKLQITDNDGLSPEGVLTLYCANGSITKLDNTAPLLADRPTCDPITCTVAAGQTWSVAGKTCANDAVSASFDHGTYVQVIDDTASERGTAAFECVNGTAQYRAAPPGPFTAATCNTDCPVTAGVTPWPGGCFSDTNHVLRHGEIQAVLDATGSPTGGASLRCNNGVIEVEAAPAPTCSAGCTITAGVTDWPGGCFSDTSHVLTHGQTQAVVDSVVGPSGSATLRCNNGVIEVEAAPAPSCF